MIIGVELLLALVVSLVARHGIDRAEFRIAVAEALEILKTAKTGDVEFVNTLLQCSTETEAAIKLAEQKPGWN